MVGVHSCVVYSLLLLQFIFAEDGVQKIVLVTTADGMMHAIDKNQNEPKWKVDTGGPLTASYHSSEDRKYSVIPALDGTLLIHNKDGMKKTSVKARMLTEKAPFLSSQDNLIFSSQKQSRLLGVDMRSGVVFHDSSNSKVNSGSSSHKASGIASSSSLSSTLLQISNQGEERISPLWLGRIDYSLQAIDKTTGLESFSMTYSEVHPVSEGFLSGHSSLSEISGDEFAQDSAGGGLYLPSSPAARDTLLSDSLVSTPDGRLFFAESSFEDYEDGSDEEFESDVDGYDVTSAGGIGILRKKRRHRLSSIRLHSPAVKAFELTGDLESEEEKFDVHSIRIAHRMPSSAVVDESARALEAIRKTTGSNKKGAMDHEDYDDENNRAPSYVVMRSHNENESGSGSSQHTSEGGLFAMEIEAGGLGDLLADYSEDDLRILGLGSKVEISSQILTDVEHDEDMQDDAADSGGMDLPSAGERRDRLLTSINSLKAKPGVPRDHPTSPLRRRIQNALLSYSESESASSSSQDSSSDSPSASSSPLNNIGRYGLTFGLDLSDIAIPDRLKALAPNDAARGGSGASEGSDSTLPGFIDIAITEIQDRNKRRRMNLQEGKGRISLTGLSVLSFILETAELLFLVFLVLFVTVMTVLYVVEGFGLFALPERWRAKSILTNLVKFGGFVGANQSNIDEPSQMLSLAATLRRETSGDKMAADIFETASDGTKLLRVGSLGVSTVVLGYGSQGTVVFRGSLNGRPVAVKRMLAQFSRSAEREISLLIRSDGHPNVVRYFLREEKGEFVYLALQLCQMSLREFVLKLQQARRLRREVEKREKLRLEKCDDASSSSGSRIDEEIPDEARGALLQMAVGLAHLHSQRIVHRDIKPHNILCAAPEEADIKKSVSSSAVIVADKLTAGDVSNKQGAAKLKSENFDSISSADSDELVLLSLKNLGKYVLKISDMGLSKQLDREDDSFASISMPSMIGMGGDESLNASSSSSLGQRKAAAQGKNHNPIGTIGWQAPELMALRNNGGNSSPRAGVTPSNEGDDGDKDMGIECDDYEEQREDDELQENLITSDSLDVDVSENPSISNTTTPSISSGKRKNLEKSNLVAVSATATTTAGKTHKQTTLTRKTQNVDVFSLGCVFHFVLVPGVHPYGEWFEREANIMNNKADLSSLVSFPDALDLVQRMIQRDPLDRPSAAQVCKHPFFWPSQKRLDFFIELSDRLEHEPASAAVVLAIESGAVVIVGRSWDRKLHAAFLEDMGKYRKYDTASVRDLLRVIRNKRHHFNELPEVVKSLVGASSLEFVSYFESRFPKLLMHCVRVACCYLSTEKSIASYCASIASLFRSTAISSSSSLLSTPVSLFSRKDNSTSDSISTVIESDRISSMITVTLSEAGASSTVSIDADITSSSLSGHVPGNIEKFPDILSRENRIDGSDGGRANAEEGSINYAEDEASSALSAVTASWQQLVQQTQDVVVWRGSALANSLTQTIQSLHQQPQQRGSARGGTGNPISSGKAGGGGSNFTQQQVISFGWWRSQDHWITGGRQSASSTTSRGSSNRPSHLIRSASDARYRSRLCTHWELTGGTQCPMRKKAKCDFAHGPLELRIKESRRGKWGSAVSVTASASMNSTSSSSTTGTPLLASPTIVPAPHQSISLRYSGGEDVLGAARSIEKVRAAEGSVSEFERQLFGGAGSNPQLPRGSSGKYNNYGNQMNLAGAYSSPMNMSMNMGGFYGSSIPAATVTGYTRYALQQQRQHSPQPESTAAGGAGGGNTGAGTASNGAPQSYAAGGTTFYRK